MTERPTIRIATRCPGCNKIEDIVCFKDEYLGWQAGANLQEVMPEMSPERREQLITGYCDPCFTALFPPDD